MALLIKVDSITAVEAPKTLEAAQKLVGGYVEIVPHHFFGHRMLCDEEGLVKDRPINPIASVMMNRTFVGDVLLMTLQEFETWAEGEGE